VTQRNGKQVVFLPANPPVLREVEIGEYNDEFIEIKKGIAAGDRVIIDGVQKTGPGAVVSPVPHTNAPAGSAPATDTTKAGGATQ